MPEQQARGSQQFHPELPAGVEPGEPRALGFEHLRFRYRRVVVGGPVPALEQVLQVRHAERDPEHAPVRADRQVMRTFADVDAIDHANGLLEHYAWLTLSELPPGARVFDAHTHLGEDIDEFVTHVVGIKERRIAAENEAGRLGLPADDPVRFGEGKRCGTRSSIAISPIRFKIPRRCRPRLKTSARCLDTTS